MRWLYVFCLLTLMGCSNFRDPSWNEFMKITEESNAAFEKVSEIGEELAEKYCLNYLNTGVGSVVDSRQTAYDFSLMSNQCLAIDQTRQVVHAFIQDVYARISKISNVHNNMHNRMVGEHFHNFDPILTPKRLGLKLNFWDANMNRPNPPYLSRVMVRDGFVYYYYAKPDQSLQEPIVEPF